MRRTLTVLLGCGILVAGASSIGQAAEDPVTREDCTVAPAPESAPGDMTTGDDSTLSDVLDPCNGVLVPAPVGDEDLTIVPPPVGTTPVIEPGEVPVQPADQD